MNNLIKKMSIVGMFLGLGIIFSYVSNYIPFFIFNFLKIDISIIFFMIPLSIIGYWYSIFIIFIIGIVNIAWSTTNFVGPFILIFSNIVFISIFNLFQKIIKFKFANIINIIISIVLTSIILSIFNGLIFTPIFLYIFTDVNTVSFVEISKNYNNGLWYDKLKIFFMFIPNYWEGIFALYTSFNLFKFLIGGIFYLYFDFLINKRNLLKIHF